MISHFKSDFLRHIQVKIVQHKRAEILEKQYETSDIKTLGCLIFEIFEI